MRPVWRLLLPVAPLAALAVVLISTMNRAPRGNVLLVVVDTLRADRLGAYGWHKNTSPHVDLLASQGALFEQMICQVPQTLPSFCSILTGTYPVTHSVRVNGLFALPSEPATLAEVFRRNGYRTAAFIAGFPLDSQFGAGRGFELYDDEMRSVRPMAGLERAPDGTFKWQGYTTTAFESTADVVAEQVMSWLDKHHDEPFFLMVHYFDPHHDYAPPARFRTLFPNPYSGEVAFVDEQFGRVLAKLDELALAEQTLVVFTADHGECLGEHGRYFHQSQLWNAALQIPCIIRWPGRVPAGTRISGSCRSVDIMPTILELAALPVPAQVQGTSLLAAMHTGETGDLAGYFENLYGKLEVTSGITRQGIQRGNWKYIYSQRDHPPPGGASERRELYDLSTDPEELVNLAGERPEQAEQLHNALAEFLRTQPAGEARTLAPDDETRAKLKALGY
ncbi:MAG: sulfatase [Planctomycetota bacterium]